MESRVTEVGPCLKEVEVTLPPERVRAALDRSYGQLRSRVVLPGFRPGRVPRNVLERRFGDQVRHEVLHELLEEGMGEAVREHQLEAVSEPSLKEQEEGSPAHTLPASGPLTFTFTVEVKPVFELPPYRGVEVRRTVEAVSEEQVQRVLEGLAERRAQWSPVEEAAYQDGDLVLGTIKGLETGGKSVTDDLETGFRVEHPMVGRGLELQEAEQVAQQAHLDEEIPVTVRITEEHPDSSLHGREAAGRFVFAELKRRTVPPLDDDLGKELGFEGLEALRQDVRQRLEADQEAQADARVVRDMLATILDQVEIPLAAGPTERILKRRLGEAALRIRLQEGVGEEEALVQARSRESDLRASVERDARCWLVLERIAKKEKIFCLEEDVDREMARIAAEHETTPSKVRQHHEEQGLMPEVRAQIIERKTCEFLRENAKILAEASPPEATETPAKEGESSSPQGE